MNTPKLLTVLVAALVVSAGAGAVTATNAANDTSVDASEASVGASYDNGTVDLTVTRNGTGVENVSVEANDEDVGATGANGTLTFKTNATEEFEIELAGEGVEHELEYEIEDGELVRESDDDDDKHALAADVSYDNGTVDLTVTRNGSTVENATVEANDKDVGTTDANGSLTFETNATEELEIELAGEGVEHELEYEIEDGELVRESNDEDSENEAGPDENASDRAHAVFGVIQDWIDDDRQGSLGQLIQDTLDNGDDDAPGNSGDAPGNSGEAPGHSADAPGNSGEAPGHSADDSESDDESESDREESESDDESEREADDDDEDDGDEDDDDEDDGNPGNVNPGNGNGNN